MAISSFNQRMSDHALRLVQVLFGVVLGQSLLLYRDVVLSPWKGQHFLATLALVAIYITTILSWVGWHRSTENNPYYLSTYFKDHAIENFRIGADILIVLFYTYTLFAVSYFISDTAASVASYLAGYVLIFGGYIIAGRLRIRAHGPSASRPLEQYVVLAIYLLLFLTYLLLWHNVGHESALGWTILNSAAVSLCLLVMIGYRLQHGIAEQRKRENQLRQNPRVAVDIDGVIADQIPGVAKKIAAKWGMSITSDQVVAWDWNFGPSDIKTEINEALTDPEYVLDMPMHPDAREFLKVIRKHHLVTLLTARPASSERTTARWIADHELPHDAIAYVAEERKSTHRSDVLIDDYVGNIVEYLNSTNGLAFLLSRPWNSDHSPLIPWEESGRLFYITRLFEAVEPLAVLRTA